MGKYVPKKGKNEWSDEVRLRDWKELRYRVGDLGIEYMGLGTSETTGKDPEEYQFQLIEERRLLDTRSWKCLAYRG